MKQGKRVWWKSSPQRWKITLYFEMHSQRGTDLHSLAEFTDTCFFVGWLLFPWWLYWQGWMLCRALLVFSVCGQEIQGGKPWWFLSFLTSGILQRSGPLQGKIKSHDYSSVKTVWQQSCRDSPSLPGFSPQTVSLKLKWDSLYVWC